ncbi:XRE family transcriptional regulator [Azospirillum cavernae]|uniref:XRE family transcriptional regulator n=1 Tax=Azospirillum cavernae TaxID=2320860 RepID=A0A418VWY7_9PROT|nr:helix-turn-helix transcriptional regulator [Azospirillum cavernae]RJF81669.1 XRE family transcriptional regulator [Azospirillum cavernae]
MSALNAPNPMSDWSQLRNTLFQRRETLGLRQSDVANLAGFGLRSLERWEAAQAEPHAFNLFLWCAALGVRLVPTTPALGSKNPDPPPSGRAIAPKEE